MFWGGQNYRTERARLLSGNFPQIITFCSGNKCSGGHSTNHPKKAKCGNEALPILFMQKFRGGGDGNSVFLDYFAILFDGLGLDSMKGIFWHNACIHKILNGFYLHEIYWLDSDILQNHGLL